MKFILQLQQKIKYLTNNNNLIKEVKNLYTENYKTLFLKIDEETRNEKIVHVHGLEEST